MNKMNKINPVKMLVDVICANGCRYGVAPDGAVYIGGRSITLAISKDLCSYDMHNAVTCNVTALKRAIEAPPEAVDVDISVGVPGADISGPCYHPGEPDLPVCCACGGSGVIACAACGAEHECVQCGGYGRIDDGIACSICGGPRNKAGRIIYETITPGGSTKEYRTCYIKVIKLLPAVTSVECGERIYFSFCGGKGVISAVGGVQCTANYVVCALW